jgi:putative ABC transport system ATP-binding protein
MEKIRLENIGKTYSPGKPNETKALVGVNLVVYTGEMLGIVGASGSGKSTLLHIMGCLDTATAGTYYLDGKAVHVDNGEEAAEIRNKRIGFVLQHFGLIMERSAQENIEIPLLYANIKAKQRAKMARRMMEELAIGHLARKPCSQLSGGEKQRVAIARALVNNPEVILADEPTGALDSQTGRGIIQILRELTQEHKTVLVVTHDKEIAAACDRIVRIHDGKIVES